MQVEKADGHLNTQENATMRQSGVTKPNVQHSHHDDLECHEDLDGQDGQLSEIEQLLNVNFCQQP
jgi:hypothetical protein